MSGALSVSYYPGCSLEGSAREFDASIRAAASALSIELRELDDWSCCGASAAHGASRELALGLAARNLALAERAGRDLVIPCASCFSRLKSAEHELLAGEAGQPFPVSRRLRLWDLAEFVAQEAVLERLRPLVVRPLKGLKAVCYYGCLTQRPPKVTGATSPENPLSLDSITAALGAEPYPWSYKTDCCGASLALTRPDLVAGLVGRLAERAAECGADCLVVGCQMCQANLDSRQPEGGPRLPVLYFTELIGLALDLPEVGSWLSRHLIDARPLLAERGLL
jgi:heterodisulfide reductase subunit B